MCLAAVELAGDVTEKAVKLAEANTAWADRLRRKENKEQDDDDNTGAGGNRT